MNETAPVDLGGDILLYDGDEPETVEMLRHRWRFLDVLWLPCPLGRLTGEQIATINRFREDRLLSDAQFTHAKRSRHALVALLSAIKARSVLEIGCGKFPITNDIELDCYRGIEIDEIAINHCRKLNIDVGSLENFIGIDNIKLI